MTDLHCCVIVVLVNLYRREEGDSTAMISGCNLPGIRSSQVRVSCTVSLYLILEHRDTWTGEFFTTLSENEPLKETVGLYPGRGAPPDSGEVLAVRVSSKKSERIHEARISVPPAGLCDARCRMSRQEPRTSRLRRL